LGQGRGGHARLFSGPGNFNQTVLDSLTEKAEPNKLLKTRPGSKTGKGTTGLTRKCAGNSVRGAQDSLRQSTKCKDKKVSLIGGHPPWDVKGVRVSKKKKPAQPRGGRGRGYDRLPQGKKDDGGGGPKIGVAAIEKNAEQKPKKKKHWGGSKKMGNRELGGAPAAAWQTVEKTKKKPVATPSRETHSHSWFWAQVGKGKQKTPHHPQGRL